MDKTYLPELAARLLRRQAYTPDERVLEQDLNIIGSLAANLPYIADLAGADMFIDMFTEDRRVAIVVAEARPRTAPSLYSSTVLGQAAYAENEPAVFQAFNTEKPALNVRGISQEGVPIAQTVLPVRGVSGEIIAVLIMERDNSSQVQQEKSLKLLSETAQKLTDTLFNLDSMGNVLPTLIHDALLITNGKYEVAYMNKVAENLFTSLCGTYFAPRSLIEIEQRLPQLTPVFSSELDVEEVQVGGRTLLVRSLSLLDGSVLKGSVYLLRDITELRQKEKQLIAKSAVIKEIHHRVKNNLQTIASLLRLQMRRVDVPEVRQAFQESINRIKCIALVHEFFSRESPEIIEMKSCIEKIAAMLRESMLTVDSTVVITVQGDKIYLPSEKATPVAIIVNELLQNALEHGMAGREAGQIAVDIVAGPRVQISVADDGRGLPANFSLESMTNLGLQIALTLVRENLGGDLRVLPREKGTRAELVFPSG
ncbi:MAG: sensor histidine kinase [Desulfurispora sp.]|uniref:sensor histidine kinase n=1 Tax=Desulfurispora sp. TaxID=3014275 RepID=UPI0040491101